MQVNIFYKTAVPQKFKKSALFKNAVLLSLGKSAPRDGVVNVVFVPEKEIHKINKNFLGHNFVTDVVTFPYPYGAEDKKEPFGDIFICYKAAAQNAPLYGHSVLEEMLTYAAHGALHLAGMDDDTKKKRAAMDKKAELILKRILPGRFSKR